MKPHKLKKSSSFLSAIILVIVAVHFVFFQPALSPLFDSDGAMHILMSKRFYFPEGLYYWGQNRLGSMIPLLSWPWVAMGFNALWVVSIIQSFFLILTYRNFTIKVSSLGKITVALLLFIPFSAWNYLISTGQPYIPQLYAFSILYKITMSQRPWTPRTMSLFIAVSWFSLWISDLAIIYIIPILLYGYSKSKKPFFTWIKENAKPFVLGFVGGVLLLILKNQLPRAKGYDQIIGPPSEWWSLTQGVFRFFKGYFVDFSIHPYETIAVYCVAIVALAMLLKKRTPAQRVLNLSQVLVLVFLLTSHWVFVNGLRYFSLPLFLLTLFLVQRVNANDSPRPHSSLQSALSVLLLIGGIMFSVGNIQSRRQMETPTVFMPKTAEIKKVASTFSHPAIGDYWTVYLYCAYAEGQPMGIADENWAIRNAWEKESVIQSDTVLIFESPRLKLEDSLNKYNVDYSAVTSVYHVGETAFRIYIPSK